MRSWVVRLSLLAFVVGFTPPAWAGTLNDLFTFADIPYTFNPPPNPDQPFGSIHAEAAQGQFQGMRNVNLSFHYVPDPEGPGHPLFSPVRFEGVIPELGITENSLLFDGRINNIPEEFPGFLRFPVARKKTASTRRSGWEPEPTDFSPGTCPLPLRWSLRPPPGQAMPEKFNTVLSDEYRDVEESERFNMPRRRDLMRVLKA